MQYFGSNIAGGAAESWVETKLTWMEVDGAGWKSVHGLVIPIFETTASLIRYSFPYEL